MATTPFKRNEHRRLSPSYRTCNIAQSSTVVSETMVGGCCTSLADLWLDIKIITDNVLHGLGLLDESMLQQYMSHPYFTHQRRLSVGQSCEKLRILSSNQKSPDRRREPNDLNSCGTAFSPHLTKVDPEEGKEQP